MDKYALGIDFGTTNSRIAFIPTGQLAMNLKEQLSPVRTVALPTLYDPGKGYRVYIGEEALDRGDWVPRFKLEMGNIEDLDSEKEGPTEKIKFKEIEIEYSPELTIRVRPEALAACVIAKLREVSSERNKKLKGIRNVTITVPAEWTFLQRRATVFAAKVADYNNVRTLQEPLAAFLYLAEVRKDELVEDPEVKKILVFDFGGGTCDISIIVREGKKALPYVLAGSMVECGGEHIDARLSRYLVSNALWGKAKPNEHNRLRERAKVLKEFLNPRDPKAKLYPSHAIEAPMYIGKDMVTHFSLRQEDLKSVVDAILPTLKDTLGIALDRANLDCSHIDRVLMVGGSSYLREVQDFMEEYFCSKGKELTFANGGIILHDAEEAVAFGAAVYQYYKLHRKKVVDSTLSLETYLRYEKQRDDWDDHPLGRRGQILPIPRIPSVMLHSPLVELFLFEPLPLPKDKDEIDWYVYQRRIVKKEGEQVEKPVERVKISEYKPGYATRLRICYRIDEEGNLTYWKPYLTNDRGFPVMTESVAETSLYDLTEHDIPEIRKQMGINSILEKLQ